MVDKKKVLRICKIATEMNTFGEDQNDILDCIKYASEYEGLYDLMCMYEKAFHSYEKADTWLDIKELLNDIKHTSSRDKVPHKFYLHSTKDEMHEIGEQLGLKELALESFKYTLYEVTVNALVDTVTGEVEVKSFEYDKEYK